MFSDNLVSFLVFLLIFFIADGVLEIESQNLLTGRNLLQAQKSKFFSAFLNSFFLFKLIFFACMKILFKVPLHNDSCIYMDPYALILLSVSLDVFCVFMLINFLTFLAI